MWLLNTSTLERVYFVGYNIPQYVILSHTWKPPEVSFRDLPSLVEQHRRDPRSHISESFSKVSRCCELAASENLQYVWIDTCCIDKDSSAELSEAINSMYQWYAQSFVCYVLLVDVSVSRTLGDDFIGSRWFTRGWTLQELLAPTSVVFYDKDWIEIGTKRSLI